MRILSTAAGAAASTYARELRARAALKQAEESRRSEVSADAAKARSSPRFEASETRKTQARAKLQQVREWLKIVRKLYAQNPKAMAKALAQAFKDLKSAVEAFKDAGGREMGATGEAVGAVLTASSGGKDEAAGDADQTEGEDGEGDREREPDPSPEGEAVRAAFEGRSLYDAVVGEVRKQLGEEGLDFLKEVRGMTNEIKKLLEAARGQAAIARRDKETDKAFEETDKALKDLDETMDQMEREIRHEAPTAGMKLSVAA
jgi:Skp family chaperone for outer membrane proteins